LLIGPAGGNGVAPSSVRIAAGDVNHDGTPDIIAATSPGATPLVKVFNGVNGSLFRKFLAYERAFQGGVSVAAADFNGDGFADIATAANSNHPVRIFDGQTGAMIKNFVAYNPGFANTVSVAAGDIDGDGTPDIITAAGPGSAPLVKILNGLTRAQIDAYFAFDQSFEGGLFVAGNAHA
jgi:FG-GAP-like repeat/FG-GAP repeat